MVAASKHEVLQHLRLLKPKVADGLVRRAGAKIWAEVSSEEGQAPPWVVYASRTSRLQLPRAHKHLASVAELVRVIESLLPAGATICCVKLFHTGPGGVHAAHSDGNRGEDSET